MEDFNIKAELGTFRKQQINFLFSKFYINLLIIWDLKQYLNIAVNILESFKNVFACYFSVSFSSVLVFM